MTLEFDHLFICTAIGAPEADRLVQIGLTEGQSNSHPGQGSACRRFFGYNAYLEFLWVQDKQAACRPPAAPLQLWERSQYRQSGHAPFGLGLRSTQQADPYPSLPFTTWAYRPPYLPPPLQIEVAVDSIQPGVPLVFHFPGGKRPDHYPLERQQPLVHGIRVQEITDIALTLPTQSLSCPLIQTLADAGLARFIPGEGYRADVTFDGGKQKQRVDCQPALPLVLHW
ncbi:hypothetical protein BST81_08635 [Leptolyngbya sp. 'hensonii']|uniref:hypothetical protein n=1 Tax=Leptolyngbya sp. 'hensonii' TaxID=1922337 RepID=UPI00094F4D8A|nr:hypothetical protein [Leptolyngbya sp. 'hensonii']OLP18795.1 hypothetical protein BST81_08635 [Leptolyngbya sp. 'hensonii']